MSGAKDGEPTPERVSVGNRLLALVEDVIYVGIAVVLAGSALVVLVQAVGVALAAAREGGPMIEVLDRLLLVFIFVELLYAVRETLRERQIVAEPFLVVGILAAIKEVVVLSVEAAQDYLERGPLFERAMIEIALLGALVLVLSASAVLLRRKEQEPEENAGKPEAPEERAERA